MGSRLDEKPGQKKGSGEKNNPPTGGTAEGL
jgi:hypothetical protein